MVACSLGVPSAQNDTRATTRASISGRVILSTVSGLNDPSRVRVDIGKGEGGTNIEADGSFSLSDLEPDVYELEVTYVGGLTSDASGSAYEPYSTRILANEGGSIHLPEIVLVVGKGTVSGQVNRPGGANIPDSTLIELVPIANETSEAAAENVNYNNVAKDAFVRTDGTFTLESVGIGRYEAVVSGEGLRGCLGALSVNESRETVVLDPFDLASTQVSFLPGTGQVFEPTQRRTWFLQNDSLTINMVASYATQMRSWIGDLPEGDRPIFTAFSGSRTLAPEELTSSETTISFQFKDACGYTSKVEQLHLLRDSDPPAFEALILNQGDLYGTSNTLSLQVVASDQYSETLEMRTNLCTVPNANDAISVLEPEEYQCDVDIDSQPWTPLVSNSSITFPTNEGGVGLQIQLRDFAGNETAIWGRATIIDTVGPQNISLTVGNGSGLINTLNAPVTLAATGADFMKVGTTAGLPQAPWQTFSTSTSVILPEGDGSKNIYARFKDLAGNQSTELVQSVSLDSTPPPLPAVTAAAFVDTDELTVLFSNNNTADMVEASWLPDFSALITNSSESEIVYAMPSNEEGPYTIYVRFADIAGNRSASVAVSTILDETPPTIVSAKINFGNSYIQDTSAVAIETTCYDLVAGGNQLQLKVTDAANNVVYNGAYSPLFNVSLPSTEGASSLEITCEDPAGNTSSPYELGYTVDNQAPTSASIVIENNAIETNRTNLNVAVSAVDNTSGVAEFKLSTNSACTGGAWQIWDTEANILNTSILVPPADNESQSISVIFKDHAGNISDCVTDEIRVDTEPLTLTGFQINANGPTQIHTNSPTVPFVQLGHTGRGECTTYEISESAAFDTSLTQTYSCATSAGNYILNSYDQGGDLDGLKTLYARVLDRAGNASASLSAFVILDTIRPTIGSVSFLAGDDSASGNLKYTKSNVVTVEITNIEGAHEIHYILKASPGSLTCPSSVTQMSDTIAVTSGFTLAINGDGQKRLCVALTDEAGNVSPVRSDTITLDQTLPAQPGVTNEQIIGANHSCAEVTPGTNPNSLDDNFWKWEVRENGGNWKTTDANGSNIPVNQAPIEFNLEQDSDNVLEIRAVDKAGNRGESSQVYAEEISSFFIPTDLEIKQICNGGEYAILKDLSVKNSAYLQVSSGFVRFVQFPRHALLNLRTYEYRPLSPVLTSFDLCANTTDMEIFESQIIDASCSGKDEEPALLIASPALGPSCSTMGTETYNEANTRLWVYTDPFGTTEQTSIELAEVENQNGYYMAINAIDALEWGTNNEFTALITVSRRLNSGTYYHRLHHLTGDSSSAGYTAEASPFIDGITRSLGVNFNHLRGLSVINNFGYSWLQKLTTSSSWKIYHQCYNTTYCEDTSSSTIMTIPNSQFTNSDGNNFSPYGTSVSPAQNFHFSQSSSYSGANNFIFINGDGDAYAYRYDHQNTSVERSLLGNGAGSGIYPAVFDRGYQKVGWVNNDNPRMIYDHDNYGTNPKTFRHAVTRDKPIFGDPNREDTTEDGEPFVIYHTESLSEGVVIGYEDNAGCAE